MKNFLLLFSFLFISFNNIAQAKLESIDADNSNIQYIGRVDNSNPKEVRFAYPGVSIFFAFEGRTCNIRLRDISMGQDPSGKQLQNYYNITIDGKQPFVLKAEANKELYKIDSLSHSFHTIKIFKRTEALVGEGVFLGFQIEKGGTVKEMAASKKLKLEFIGNSITCGYGNEGANKECKFSAETENNYLAYGAVTARNLNAEYVAVAFSGKGVLQNYDMSKDNTMPDLYRLSLPFDDQSQWDFKKWTPDIVMINLGTNDFAHSNPDSAEWVNKYLEFVGFIRSNYPHAHVVCCVGSMMSDNWPVGNHALTTIRHYLNAVVHASKKKGDHKVHYFEFPTQSNNYGCDWHPGIKTHEQMATKLTEFLNKEIINKHKME